MYKQLKEINHKPEPFEVYTADVLWTDPHTSEQMLAMHLNADIDLASRNREFIDRSVAWISDRFSVGKDTRICDFGCGPGLYTSALAARGAQVTGIDFSAHSIDYARRYADEAGLKINYEVRNYLDYTSEKEYDLITMIMCDYCALNPAQRRKLLAIFNRVLDRNGAILLDVHSLADFARRQEAYLYEHRQLNGFWSKNDYYGFVNTFKYEEEKVVLDKYTIVEEAGLKVVYNWLQYFSRQSLASELQEAGFIIQEIYADVAGTEYSDSHTEFAVVALKDHRS